MSLVSSWNEWDPLEEVIVGSALNARFPTPDPSTRLAEFPDRELEQIPRGPFPRQIVEETEEDLAEFVRALEENGVTVRRPDPWPHDAEFSTVHWSSSGYYNYCPRDIMLVVGDQILETPNVIRSRSQETSGFGEHASSAAVMPESRNSFITDGLGEQSSTRLPRRPPSTTASTRTAAPAVSIFSTSPRDRTIRSSARSRTSRMRDRRTGAPSSETSLRIRRVNAFTSPRISWSSVWNPVIVTAPSATAEKTEWG